ncbi:MAG: hypothetical protein JOY62_17140 [Acidobacteriaceae bacterium]|nr:hypothetical protein [Acidobacteriaceae bacterium]MBV9781690.1 hypothetical protein [Acidobacteriaceae bacterium]
MNYKSALLVVTAAVMLSGEPHEIEVPKHPQAESLIREADQLPPEFAADIILLLIEYGFVPDHASRNILLEKAFSLAASAQEPVALQRAEQPGPVSNALNDVFKEGLDEVSLESRTIRLFARSDPARARELFEHMSLPLGTTFTCTDPLYYDLSIYYAAMLDIANTLPDRQMLEHFLQHQASQLRSIAQIAPTVRIVLNLRQAHSDLNDVLKTVVTQLPNLDHDPRIFSFDAVNVLSAMSDIDALSVIDTDYVAQQSRKWLLKEMKAGFCTIQGGTVARLDGSQAHLEPLSPVDFFNQRFASSANGALIIRSTGIENSPTATTPDSERHSHRYLELENTYEILATPEAQRSATWQSDMNKFVEDVLQWSDGQLSESERARYYVEKSALMRSILSTQKLQVSTTHLTQGEWQSLQRAVPLADVPARDAVAQATVNFFDGPTARLVYNRRRALWFAPVRSLLRSFAEPVAVEPLSASPEPVAASYAALVKLFEERGTRY